MLRIISTKLTQLSSSVMVFPIIYPIPNIINIDTIIFALIVIWLRTEENELPMFFSGCICGFLRE
jgi:TRAP-type C4-dicarboxylate transport system permease large subunit